jgi:hypothetical protein
VFQIPGSTGWGQHGWILVFWPFFDMDLPFVLGRIAHISSLIAVFSLYSYALVDFCEEVSCKYRELP